MKVLIIGKGGREHALAWKIAQSPLVEKVFVAPGNDGMSKNYHCVAIAETDNMALIAFAKKEQIDLTIVGPENALLNGIANDFHAAGLTIFAPTKEAAMIEGSKSFAKMLMQKYGIPTADFEIFANYDSAQRYVQQKNMPIVIKFDGLAAGKGVVVAQTQEEANNALKEMLVERKFGDGNVVVEEFLSGIEFSLMALTNGSQIIALPVAQDHKRAFDGDNGPNTGGMGAYSPVPAIDQKIVNQAVETVLVPMAKAMVAEGVPFCGILYGGLMLTEKGVKVIEFNARFGDPETEVVLPKISSDLAQHIVDILAGNPSEIACHDDFFLGVVMATKGYPAAFEKGSEISGLDTVANTVFHMGTAWNGSQWTINGGRVLFVLGRGANVEEAYKDAYNAVAQITCTDLYYRTDIGYQTLGDLCTK